MPVMAGPGSIIGWGVRARRGETAAAFVSTVKSWRWLDGASMSASGISCPSNSAATRRLPPTLPVPR
jgi:hypothetical protein